MRLLKIYFLYFKKPILFRVYYRALIASSVESEIIAFIHDGTEEISLYPPGFAAAFAKPVIGIITKIDLCEDEKNIFSKTCMLNNIQKWLFH